MLGQRRGSKKLAELVFGQTGVLDDFLEKPPRQFLAVDRYRRHPLREWMPEHDVACCLLRLGDESSAFESSNDFLRSGARQAREHT